MLSAMYNGREISLYVTDWAVVVMTSTSWDEGGLMSSRKAHLSFLPCMKA